MPQQVNKNHTPFLLSSAPIHLVLFADNSGAAMKAGVEVPLPRLWYILAGCDAC